MKRKTLCDARKLAKYNGGECLSTEYINWKTKMLWECEKKHQWKATYSGIQQSYWCPECAGNEKNTLLDAQTLATKHNGKCLSSTYINSCTKMNWRCERGHQWEAKYNSIQQGSWCPKCTRRSKKTICDVQNLAKVKNGECLSREYTNANTKMLWKCEKGHQWETTYGNIKQGSWCPKCKVKKMQWKLTNILQELIEEEPLTIRPKWLKNPETNYSLEIDIYFPECKVAVEYNGRQHYEPVDFAGKGNEWAKKNLKNIQTRDRLKQKLIEQNPDKIKHFIIFTYMDIIDKENVKDILIKKGIYNVNSIT